MRESVIRYPANSKFIVRHDWAVRAMREGKEFKGPDKTPDAAAELLSVFEHHHGNRWSNKLIKAELERGLRTKSLKMFRLGDWLFYTYEYLRECLLGTGTNDTLIKALDLLDRMGFIDRKPPSDLADAFPQSGKGAVRLWVKLEVANINAWIDENYSVRGVYQKPEAPQELEVSDDNDQTIDASVLEQLEKSDLPTLVKSVCLFYKYIHAKNESFIFNDTRKLKVQRRIKEQHKSVTMQQRIGRCTQAIIGNVLSDFHQGRTDTGTIYDDIDLIFRNPPKFESFIRVAEQRGLSWEKAYTHFEGFLKDEPSKYAKKPEKTLIGSTNGNKAAIPISLENQKRYRDFARTIAPFFASNMEAKDVTEFAISNAPLIEISKGLTDTDFLLESTMEAVRVFKKEIPDEMMARIAAFVKGFCKLQEINR